MSLLACIPTNRDHITNCGTNGISAHLISFAKLSMLHMLSLQHASKRLMIKRSCYKYLGVRGSILLPGQGTFLNPPVQCCLRLASSIGPNVIDKFLLHSLHYF